MSYRRHPFLYGIGIGCAWGCITHPFLTLLLALLVLVFAVTIVLGAVYALYLMVLEYWWFALGVAAVAPGVLALRHWRRAMQQQIGRRRG